MAAQYPYGYAGAPAGMGSMLEFQALMSKATVAKMHPEFRRRVFAMMEAALMEGVHLGIGTAWRVQPVGKIGFASPGNSNHEGFPADGTSGGAVAADMVPPTAWDWMDRNAARFGLKTFRTVNNEPWHIQPVEIPNSRRWRAQPWDLPRFDLPQGQLPMFPPPSQKELYSQYAEESMNATFEGKRRPHMPDHEQREGADNQEVFLLQRVINDFAAVNSKVPNCGNPDGKFGPRTKAGLTGLQQEYLESWGAGKPDGVYGPRSHLALQKLSDALASFQ